jgi:hypothetical protein
MKKSFLFLCFLFFTTSFASASYIQLRTTVTSRVENNTLNVSISAVNKGDESAYNVQAEVQAAGETILLTKAGEIKINESYKDGASRALDLKRPGEYPLIVILHYTDANQYPFSALTGQTFSYHSSKSPATLLGKINGKSFWEKGKLRLTLKNISDAEIKLSAYLVVPGELRVEDRGEEAKIPARGEQGVKFNIKNLSALSGSNYQVLAVAEYEEAGRHRTRLTPGLIKIVKRRTFLGMDYIYLVIGLGALILLFIAAQFIKKE